MGEKEVMVSKKKDAESAIEACIHSKKGLTR
jgi:hypothetical protein